MEKNRKIPLGLMLSAAMLFASQTAFSSTGGKIHAFYADEHNTSPTDPTGNRILEIDIENMELVNVLDVPGLLGHHADYGFKSKIYGVPKGSGFVNVIEVRKGQDGSTSMELTKKIDLIHMPRSGDAYNEKLNVILMTARNRPMGSFIDVDTDEVVGTIGEDIDCKLTDGSYLLSHPDANTVAGATRYQCQHADFGGDQISGHPYWLTDHHAAIVDRSNRRISVYYVWRDGDRIESRLLNHLGTRTSIHQIVPRDRSSLPRWQQFDFYAIEEGNQGSDRSYGIPHSVIKMKLTRDGLRLVRRMNLARSVGVTKRTFDYIEKNCRHIASVYGEDSGYPPAYRYHAFKRMFGKIRMRSYVDQIYSVDFPVECLSARVNGGHNADFISSFSPDNHRLFVGSAGGFMHVINIDEWVVENTVDTGGLSGTRSGSGHTCFAPQKELAIVTNHTAPYHTVIDMRTNRKIGDIHLPFTRENIFNSVQSHTCYIDEAGEYYYNFWTDGGVFYKIDLDSLSIVDSLYTGGIPIQGSFISLDDIKTDAGSDVVELNDDTAWSDGGTVAIDVLANDTGSDLVLFDISWANYGQLEIEGGKVLYTPEPGFSGTDEFWYGVKAGSQELWALVTVTVEPDLSDD